MSRQNIVLTIAAIALLGIGALAGVLISNALLAGSGDPSEEISAPLLDPNVTPTPGYGQVVATNEALGTALAEQIAANDVVEATASAAEATITSQQAQLNALNIVEPSPEPTLAPRPTDEPASDPVTTEEAAEDASTDASGSNEESDTTETTGATTQETAGQRVLFRIDQSESEVRFIIDEVLAGQPTTVVGVTDQVAGDIVVDFVNPGSSQVGTIRINVRTLETDNRFRNDAIRGRILESSRDEFEFSDFVPTELVGLPDTVAIGDTIEFQIIGDLTIKDVTRSLTFDTTVTVVSEDRIEGNASTTMLYRDFGLTIPDVPGVSDIADEVGLEIDFVANLAQS
ncbi:MAG: YceI family protein [Chloroflexota bacterium]